MNLTNNRDREKPKTDLESVRRVDYEYDEEESGICNLKIRPNDVSGNQHSSSLEDSAFTNSTKP